MWTNTEEAMVITMITDSGVKAEGFIAHWPRRNGYPASWTARFDIFLPDGQRIRHYAEDPTSHLRSNRYFRGHRQARNWIGDTLKMMFPQAEFLAWR